MSALRRPRAEDELGWSALLLSYRLSWPVTLILPPRALVQYQVIFKWVGRGAWCGRRSTGPALPSFICGGTHAGPG